MKNKKVKNITTYTSGPPKLTEEEINKHSHFEGLSENEKLELINFIYAISDVL